jgi:NADH:ubiquinone oxidoreductase subunit 5 (subunit L)/multisubunit Na+/H+ antiporter MnhA subunit
MDDQAGSGTAPAKTKNTDAKEISKWSMVVASIWIAGLSLLKAFWPLLSGAEFGLTMNEILLSGVVLAAVFTPVYLSLWIDKFTMAFKGGDEAK